MGVYTYSSRAVYEGEWRGNLKDGRGVYYFPKGGVYEGEWRGGERDGIGVQTFASGKIKVCLCMGGVYVLEKGYHNKRCTCVFPHGVILPITSVFLFHAVPLPHTQAGRWSGGQLVESLPLWQCSGAVEGAIEAAAAARGYVTVEYMYPVHPVHHDYSQAQ